MLLDTLGVYPVSVGHHLSFKFEESSPVRIFAKRVKTGKTLESIGLPGGSAD